MNAIIHEVFVAPNKDNLKVSLFKTFLKEMIKLMHQQHLRDAASVAVAIPAYIDPITDID